MSDTLEIFDFKFGRKRVYASEMVNGVERPNLQMACYALGALEAHGIFHDYTHVRMTIIQPFIGNVSEYTCTVEQLLETQEFLRQKAIECDTSPNFAPSEHACHYCKAKMTCQARANAALEIGLEGFEDIDRATVRVVPANQLGSIYEKLGLLTDFCKDIAKRVYSELAAGRPVLRNDGTGYKLVAGKKGDRRFDDPAAVEALLRSFRVPQDLMYQPQKLATLTSLEKLAKQKRAKKGETAEPAVIGPTQWAKVAEHIQQPDGKPSIAHESDPRDAITPNSADGFEEVESDDIFE